MQPLTARLVPFKRRGGRENMAIDEHLLLRHGPSGTPVLRIYGWQPPAITLGRYQGTDRLDLEACRHDAVPVVRRITGGGAIYHDNEMTYSVVWPDDGDSGSGCIERSFERINAFILETYRSLGLNPVYAKECNVPGISTGRTHFCFSGNENYDILINGRKIGGNAQKRVRGSLLQHGSIPLAMDAGRVQRYFRDRIETGNFAALNEACGREVSSEEIIGIMTAAFSNVMGVDLSEQGLDNQEEESVRALLRERYSLDRWNYTALTEGQ
jgi:lipoyl(octanoyl) transferase